jgi:hypothetical protein
MNLINELETEKNHADHMTAMAQHWMERAQEAERMIATLVRAAGGEIKVHHDQLVRHKDDCELIRAMEDWDRSVRFIVRERAHA